MAGALKIKHGTKLYLAFDVPAGQEPKFNMISTFNKSVDDSAFLTSVPMVGGKPLKQDENQKLLFRYGDGDTAQVIAGYVDDEVKEGIRRYWKVRRVTEDRHFVKRADIRMKVEIPVKFMQDTWALKLDGEIDKETGTTMDISNNGLAVYLNHWFEVGETCIFTLPRMGTASDGQDEIEVVGVVCWMREVPKGGAYRFAAGIQLKFADIEERRKMQDYVAYVKKRYKL